MRLLTFWLSFLIFTFVLALDCAFADATAAAKNALNAIKPLSLQASSGSAFFQAGMNCYRQRLLRVSYFVQADGVLFFFNDRHGACYIAAIYTDKIPTAPVGQVCLLDQTHYALFFKPDIIAAARAQSQANNPAFAQFVSDLNACFRQNTLLATTVIEKIQQSRQLHPRWNE